ncbi:MAG: carboxymuconolactone decarboxylase family protein [Omnitrophica WOR_2 bacterium]
MEPRLIYKEVAPEGFRTMLKLGYYVNTSGLEPSLLNLIRLRASQINGCAYCIDIHTREARARGETEQRLYALSAWRETPFYSDRERAALAWTEAVTLISESDVPDELYESVRPQFSEKELVDLTFAVISINSSNRLAVSFRTVPGSYQPHKTEPIRAQA